MKISIIGAGKVGSAIGFSLLHTIRMDELVLIDIVEDLVRGEIEDLNHAKVALCPECMIHGGKDYALLKGSDIVIITAGKARKQGDDITREDLFEFNKKIIGGICGEIKDKCAKAKIVILTNPATQIGEFVKKEIKNEIVAMDNQLDTARLKYYISEETGKKISEIKSFISGTHGEDMKINFLDEIPEGKKETIKEKVFNAGRNVIEMKGYTCWGIASQVTEVVKGLIE